MWPLVSKMKTTHFRSAPTPPTPPGEFTATKVLELFKKGSFLFVRGGSALGNIRPWGADIDEDRAAWSLTVPREKVAMILCVRCGFWRTVPGQTAHAFDKKKKEFRCKHSPWIATELGCSAELNDEEARYPRTGNRPADRR